MAVQRWEAGTSEISQATAMAIELAYRVSHIWLLTGETDPWIKGNSQAGHDQSSERYIERPLIPGAATCGQNGEIQDPGPGAVQIPLRLDLARQLLDHCGGGSQNDLYFLRCHGDSMRPTIQDKDLALVNASVGLRMAPRNNGIYLVRRQAGGEDARVKRIRMDMERGQLILASDNQVYPPTTIDLDGIPLHQIVLGRVVWISRILLESDPAPEDW